MIGVHDLPLFVAAGLLLNLTPGGVFIALGARLAASVRNRAWAMNDDALPKSE